MTWIDRALATLSPADVAERLRIAISVSPPEENYAALRRALPRMTALDLAQLAAAFDIPFPQEAPQEPVEMLFDAQERATAVLAHFLTQPDEMNVRLDAYLRGHPRALAYFDPADAERLLILGQKKSPLSPAAALVVAAAASIALGFGLVHALHL